MNQQEFKQIQEQIKTGFANINSAFNGLGAIMEQVKKEMKPEDVEQMQKAVNEFEGVSNQVTELKKRFEGYGSFS